MTQEERVAVVAALGEICAEADRPLMAGAGTNSTAATIAEVAGLTDAADLAATLIVVPYYTRPSVEGIVDHFHLVADVSPVPVVAYNVPYRTGRGLDADAVIALAQHPNVVGLKQSVGMVDTDTLDVLGRAPADFAVLAGDDAFIGPTVLLGGAGAISAAAHLCTPAFVEMVRAGLGGDAATTARLTHALLRVVTRGFAEPNPAVFKAALAAAGDISSATVRRPLTAASVSATTALVDAVTAATRQLG